MYNIYGAVDLPSRLYIVEISPRKYPLVGAFHCFLRKHSVAASLMSSACLLLRYVLLRKYSEVITAARVLTLRTGYALLTLESICSALAAQV